MEKIHWLSSTSDIHCNLVLKLEKFYLLFIRQKIQIDLKTMTLLRKKTFARYFLGDRFIGQSISIKRDFSISERRRSYIVQ